MNTEKENTTPATGWLNRIGRQVKRFQKLLIAVVLILGTAVFAYAWLGRKKSAGDYLTAKADRNTVEVDVSATGTVQAVTTVQVGSQVSGTVAWLGADFKSQVKRGQVIAKLDPATFQAAVDIARANLANAEAAVQAATTDISNQTSNVGATVANQAANQAERDDAIALARQDEQLRGIISDREIQAAENQARVAIAKYNQATSQIGQSQAGVRTSKAKVQEAIAAVGQAKAQLEQANINLQHTVITSPIDGVVVSRNIDVGQTVAASLQAPTLFTIANDLTNMQVLASIDEADVGQIHEGIKANFSVDAFPGQTFSGDITQIRLNAQSQQNVVTYTAVINVSNPDQKLLPGMTANITIPVAQRENALTVPNAALRFKPNLSDQEQQALRDQMAAHRQQGQQGGEQQNAKQPAASAGQRNHTEQGGAAQTSISAAKGAAGGQQQVIWVLAANKRLEPRFVRTGITDGRVTEIVSGDLHEGDVVVTGQTDTGSSSSSNRPQQGSSPFGQRPGVGGGPRIR